MSRRTRAREHLRVFGIVCQHYSQKRICRLEDLYFPILGAKARDDYNRMVRKNPFVISRFNKSKPHLGIAIEPHPNMLKLAAAAAGLKLTKAGKTA